MTLTVEIKPETEAELARLAAAHGVGIDAYVTTLLEEATHASSPARKVAGFAPDMVELFKQLRGLELDFERDRDTGRDVQL